MSGPDTSRRRAARRRGRRVRGRRKRRSSGRLPGLRSDGAGDSRRARPPSSPHRWCACRRQAPQKDRSALPPGRGRASERRYVLISSWVSFVPPSVRNKAVGAAIIPSLLDTARNAVDAIDAAEQVGLRIRGAGKAVIGPRQVLLRYRAHHIGRDQNHQFGLVIDVIATAKQRTENRQLRQTGEAVDGLLGLFLNQAGHGHRAAGGNFQRRLGAAGLDRGNGQRVNRRRGHRLRERDRIVVRQLGYFGHHAEADPPFGQHHRREIERDTEFLERDRGRTDVRGRVAGIAGWDRKFAAGNKGRGFARDRGQVGFGQRAHDAGALHRAERRRYRRGGSERCRRPVGPDQRPAEGAKRIGIVEIHDRGAVVHGGREIDAQLLDDAAGDFSDRNFQHHLVAAADGDRIDDLVGAAHEAGGDIGGLLRLDRVRRGAAQYYAVADAFYHDIRIRQRLLQRGTHAV